MPHEQAYPVIIFGGLALLVVVLLLIGRYYPGSGADQLRWRPTRSPETEAELELDDVDQMLAAQNEIRRRRGAPERSIDDVAREVAGAADPRSTR